MVRTRSVHPRAAAQGRCLNASQRASLPSSTRNACTLKSSTSTRLSPYGCRTGQITCVPCTCPPGCRGDEVCVCVISMRIQGAYKDYYLPGPLGSHRDHEEPCPHAGPTSPKARPQHPLPLDTNRRTESAFSCAPRNTPATIVPGAPRSHDAT